MGLGGGLAVELPARAIDELQRQARLFSSGAAELHVPLLGRRQNARNLLLQHHQLVVIAGAQGAHAALQIDALAFHGVSRRDDVAQILDDDALVHEVQLDRCLAGAQKPALVLIASWREGLLQFPVVGGQRRGIACGACRAGLACTAAACRTAGGKRHGSNKGKAPGPAKFHRVSLRWNRGIRQTVSAETESR